MLACAVFLKTMVLVWLVGRWGKDKHFKIRSGEKRIKFQSIVTRLSSSDSTGVMKLLDDRLEQCDLNLQCDHVAGKVLALLDVEPLSVPDGVLSKLSLEQRLAWLLNARCDMCFNRIRKVIPLQTTVDAVVIGHSLRAKRTIFQLQASFAERLGEFPTDIGARATSVRQQLLEQQLLLPEQTMPVMAVQVWRPLACLMQKHKWSDFSFAQGANAALTPESRQCVQPLIEAVSSMDWGRQQPVQDFSPSLSLHPGNFREWADTIRDWGSVFRAQPGQVVDPFAMQNLQLSMELLVSNFEAHADALEAVSSGFFECRQLGIHRYDLVFLIRCLTLCSSLRADNALRTALVSSLHVLFRGGMGGQANYFVNILEDNTFPLPSPTVLGHMRFVLDVAYMLRKRQEHSERFQACRHSAPALFFLLDSSPQGNVNWLMIEYVLVEANMLETLCTSAWRLRAIGRVKWDDDPDEDRVSEEKSLVEQLQSAIQRHTLPPVGLGSGRSDLQHEYHAFLHSMFLETGDFRLMRLMAQCTTAIASDKGTEAGLQRAAPIELRSFLSFLQGTSVMSDGDEDFQLEDGLFDFRSSLGIHALMHFVNNCTKGIADAMPFFWEHVYPGMNGLVKCLAAKFFRQRFIATCLAAPEGKVWHAKFEEGYSSDLVGWRFGSLAACSKALLQYEFPLRTFWDDDKLKFQDRQNPAQHQHQNPNQEPEPPQQQPRPHSEKPEGPNIPIASQACRSKFFWAWQKMFSRIANIVDHMMNWLQSCPCHEFAANTWGARSHEFARRLFMPAGTSVCCPLTGFRAAEVACGQFSSWIEAVADVELAEVSVAVEGCTAEERAKVLADCQAARQHIVFAVQAELACWQLTPRVFCGLSHFDESSARAAVASGFQQWWDMSESERLSAHTLTKSFCESGPLHEQLLEFLGGTPRHELPLVMKEAGRLLLVPVNEISVERLHAQTHTRLKQAPHAGAVAISWAHRSPRFMDTLTRQPSVLKEVATQCAQNYHPLKLLPTMGLATHPSIASVIADTRLDSVSGGFELLGSTLTYDKIAKQIVYHLDLPAQFLPTDRTFNRSSGGGAGKSSPASEPSTLQSLQQQLLLDKFRQEHTPGTFYSIKKSEVSEAHAFQGFFQMEGIQKNHVISCALNKFLRRPLSMHISCFRW